MTGEELATAKVRLASQAASSGGSPSRPCRSNFPKARAVMDEPCAARRDSATRAMLWCQTGSASLSRTSRNSEFSGRSCEIIELST